MSYLLLRISSSQQSPKMDCHSSNYFISALLFVLGLKDNQYHMTSPNKLCRAHQSKTVKNLIINQIPLKSFNKTGRLLLN